MKIDKTMCALIGHRLLLLRNKKIDKTHRVIEYKCDNCGKKELEEYETYSRRELEKMVKL